MIAQVKGSNSKPVKKGKKAAELAGVYKTCEPRDWTPRRYGSAYCSPACGGGPVVCSFERYQQAKKAAESTAHKLGRGWIPLVRENLGWHARVGSPCRRIWISLDGAQDGKIRGFMAFLGPPNEHGGSGKWAERGPTAQAAITAVLNAARRDLGLIEDIVAGLLDVTGARTAGTGGQGGR